MKAKKILMIAACLITLLTSCGTHDDTPPDPTLTPTAGTAAGSENITPTNAPDQVRLLSMEEATTIACQDAEVSEDGLENLHARLGEGDSGKEYAITFATTEKSYQYHIAASDGMILEKTVEAINQDSDTNLSSSPETVPDGTTSTSLPSKPSTPPATPQATTAPAATVAPTATSTPKPTQAPATTSTPKPTQTPVPTQAQATPDKPKETTQDEAVEIARKDAGVSKNDLRNLKVKLDYEDGVQVYDIEFDAGNLEYEYEIAASDGKILKKDVEANDNVLPDTSGTTGTTVGGIITQDAALELAKADAGISGEEIFNLEIKLGYDDGIQVYEIDFDTKKNEYEYEIAASDGKILKKDVEANDNILPDISGTPGTTAGGIITQDDALALAKADAGISGEEIFDLEVKLDYNDGIQQYEIEFCHGNYTYEYDICAMDGRIFKRECQDCDDHWHSSSHHGHHH